MRRLVKSKQTRVRKSQPTVNHKVPLVMEYPHQFSSTDHLYIALLHVPKRVPHKVVVQAAVWPACSHHHKCLYQCPSKCPNKCHSRCSTRCSSQCNNLCRCSNLCRCLAPHLLLALCLCTLHHHRHHHHHLHHRCYRSPWPSHKYLHYQLHHPLLCQPHKPACLNVLSSVPLSAPIHVVVLPHQHRLW
jgi:hypothetical protein